ncbi:hypothetical protein N474_22630 [Pseudoalteromonas luteoviolacea CPMOR-2]|uniref:HTH cro/C1-type domain-containing protein n=1 Tax=Pseudoalteromonas luteoviolacea DSM 6061 TaxID=1365250 RepID=A0A166V7D1_9GAMM|nr:DUF4177 domain-containing protein [Pseudoalteromonas luteoviolacea]KZN31797.1 hypothetical protein N475_22685 [Pseudoalteromonas luteoviolacea DSM 6061]KZN52769.1 hypothetical protein N474_22630 [Pseudoalteromonas luteoviolacea CPMOR-2]MBE0389721.1 hypothetical protein [Pseudoalteromonas luteoviolacea DSM 6061]
MKINAALVLGMRTQKSWSQEELAIASGLNLRTIQRIENEATASLQSKKALASALDINIRDLDFEEPIKKTKYEFKTIEIHNNDGFLAGLTKPKLPDIAAILNKEGENGWMAVQVLSPEMAQGTWTGKAGNMVVLLQRELLD